MCMVYIVRIAGLISLIQVEGGYKRKAFVRSAHPIFRIPMHEYIQH